MARNAEARMPSDEQKAAHVRKTRMANYQASMRLEGFYVQEGPKMSNKKTLIRKYKKLAMKCA
ncbi:YhfG family protein [Marinobacter sp. SBS5]|uniref:YhfG family protein n=1 Tax=Marinobacter sp. SBS5 TaxID=3401754 RepID=UPI003AAD8519